MEKPPKIKIPSTAVALASRYGLTTARIGQLREEGQLVALRKGGTWIYDEEQADRFFRVRTRRTLSQVEDLLSRINDKSHDGPVDLDPPDIRRGHLRDVIAMARRFGEVVDYAQARTWLLLGKFGPYDTSLSGYFVVNLDRAELFLKERQRARETAIKVAEAEREAAWPATQSVEQLADALNLHASWVRGAASFGLLPAAGATPSGDPYFEFPYRKMLELRDRRIELVGAVNQADEAAEEAAKEKRREEDAAAMRVDKERRERIDREQDRAEKIRRAGSGGPG